MDVIDIVKAFLTGTDQDKTEAREFLLSGSREAHDTMRSAEFARAVVANAEALGVSTHEDIEAEGDWRFPWGIGAVEDEDDEGTP